MRTTVDIDGPVLADLKRISREEGKPLGRIISDLLAVAIPARAAPAAPPSFDWATSPGALRVDLLDKDALYAALDGDHLP